MILNFVGSEPSGYSLIPLLDQAHILSFLPIFLPVCRQAELSAEPDRLRRHDRAHKNRLICIRFKNGIAGRNQLLF